MGPMHQESLPFLIITAQSHHHKVLLGTPWLQCHNPTISWSRMKITAWVPGCRKTFPVTCGSTPVESPESALQPISRSSRIIGPVICDVDVDIRQALGKDSAPATGTPERIYVTTGVAEALFQQVFQHYGLPEDIVSDRGHQFM
ncbi:uncharacterized protein ACWYII_039130 [Salvelinus alpinus]